MHVNAVALFAGQTMAAWLKLKLRAALSVLKMNSERMTFEVFVAFDIDD